MLYNVVFGNPNGLEANGPKNEWRVLTTGEGNTKRDFYCFDNRAIRARIRVEPTVEERTKNEMGAPKLELKWKSSNIAAYDIDEDMIWRNNTSNLNPILRPMSKKQIDKNTGECTELHILYVTLMSNYKVKSVDTPYEILHTYHQNDKYQGCVLVFTDDELNRSKKSTIITFDVYDTKREKFCNLSVNFGKVNVPEETKGGKKGGKKSKAIPRTKAHIDPTKVFTRVKVRETGEKLDPNKFTSLKCMVNQNKFLTSTYIVTEEFKDMTDHIVRYQNKNIIVVDKEHLDDPAVIDQIKKETLDKHVRAVTVVGLDLTPEIIRTAKLLFVFRYHATEKKLICQKSN